jgi:type IV secretory pathway VirJ component
MYSSVRSAAILAIAALSGIGCARARSAHIAHDRSLRSLPLYFYPSADTARPPKETIFFFGNDVGFWEAHQELAERLSADGYSVIGFDVKRYLDRLPDSLSIRDSVFLREIPAIIARSVHELNDDESPIVLAGHSFGADVALLV